MPAIWSSTMMPHAPGKPSSHFAGCTFAEIGRITRVPTFTAASRYRLGIKKLRTLLEVSR